jgi:hypothetical protein
MTMMANKLPPDLVPGDVVELRSGEAIRISWVQPNKSGRTRIEGRTSLGGCELVARWWWSNQPVAVRMATA